MGGRLGCRRGQQDEHELAPSETGGPPEASTENIGHQPVGIHTCQKHRKRERASRRLARDYSPLFIPDEETERVGLSVGGGDDRLLAVLRGRKKSSSPKSDCESKPPTTTPAPLQIIDIHHGRRHCLLCVLISPFVTLLSLFAVAQS